jgi:hypothetical protein
VTFYRLRPRVVREPIPFPSEDATAQVLPDSQKWCDLLAVRFYFYSCSSNPGKHRYVVLSSAHLNK